MLEITRKVTEIDCTSGMIPDTVFESREPIILKGLVNTWPLVLAGKSSPEHASSYLKKFYNGKPVVEYSAAAEYKGRYFYSPDLSELNFTGGKSLLTEVLDKVFARHTQEDAPSYYVGSTDVDVYLPGFRQENDIAVPSTSPMVGIWMGSPSQIACHYDVSENVACVAVGKRRFTLFPPDQIHNLYPGPVDFTPSGQAISLVDFNNPDFAKFPRFKQALAQGLIAELEAGDAIFMPTMWWHSVEGLSEFNVLVNYWWRNVPAFMGHGVNVLKHAMLSLRDLPESEKQAWKHVFDYYVFGDANTPREHIPAPAQSSLAPIDDLRARQLRAWLLNKLNR